MPRIATVRDVPTPSPLMAKPRLGTLVPYPKKLVIASCLRAAPLNVEMESGTVCTFSARLWAVTITVWRLASLSADAVGAVGAVVAAVAADASLASAAFPAVASTRQPVAVRNPRHATRTASLIAGLWAFRVAVCLISTPVRLSFGGTANDRFAD